MTDRQPDNESLSNQKKRILFVVNEAFFFLSHRRALGEALLEGGYEVHIAAPADHAWAPQEFDSAELAKIGFTMHTISLSRRGQNPLAELATIVGIFRLVQRLRPDILHLLTIKPVLYGGLIGRILGIPLVVSGFTGLGQVFSDEVGPWVRLRRWIVCLVLRLSLSGRRSLALVQNSDDQKTVADVVRNARIVVIQGSGVAVSEYPLTPIPNEQPIVMLAARLLWEKGVGVFVEAARLVKADGVSARFVLVGKTVEANPRSVPRQQLEAWVTEGVVEWWGYRDDMAATLSQCSVFCLPTIYREGVPKVLMEAASLGRPVVTSNLGGCGEIVDHGINGFTCLPSDPQAVAQHVKRLLLDRDLCRRLGMANRQVAEQRFDVKKIVKQTIDAYSGHFQLVSD
ncbi:MAG: glycosyltransferase family 4 protein [Alphaproteobacteria bacterium]